MPRDRSGRHIDGDDRYDDGNDCDIDNDDDNDNYNDHDDVGCVHSCPATDLLMMLLKIDMKTTLKYLN